MKTRETEKERNKKNVCHRMRQKVFLRYWRDTWDFCDEKRALVKGVQLKLHHDQLCKCVSYSDSIKNLF